jgi:hypothetical protein
MGIQDEPINILNITIGVGDDDVRQGSNIFIQYDLANIGKGPLINVNNGKKWHEHTSSQVDPIRLPQIPIKDIKNITINFQSGNGHTGSDSWDMNQFIVVCMKDNSRVFTLLNETGKELKHFDHLDGYSYTFSWATGSLDVSRNEVPATVP